MSSALEAFRAQREVVDQIHARVVETDERLRAIDSQTNALAHNPALRELLRDERQWLEEARRTIAEVRALRDQELQRFWPGVWRRWTLALVFALAAAWAFGAGHAWASRPHERELAHLRNRVELLDAVGQRLITMTPNERRQFDTLIKWPAPKK